MMWAHHAQRSAGQSAVEQVSAHSRMQLVVAWPAPPPAVADGVPSALLLPTVGLSFTSWKNVHLCSRAAATAATAAAVRATSMVTPRGPAPPEPDAEQRGTKAFTSPYHEFLTEQRPLLPVWLYNGEREKMLSQRWKALSETERASYNVLEGPHTHFPALAMARAPAASRHVMTTAPPVMVGDSTASAMPAAASAAAPLAAPTMDPPQLATRHCIDRQRYRLAASCC